MNDYLLTLSTILQTVHFSYGYISLVPLTTFALIIGSYLNVVIYRGSSKYIPSNYTGKLSVVSPKHSFCPECLHQLSWGENIPIISWLIQAAKCKHCKAPISIQYPAIEAANTVAWIFLWMNSKSISEFITYAFFVSVLIAVTVIDIKTLKIPNKITLGGIAALLALSLLTETTTATAHKILAVFGAATLGYLLVELGKMLFGKKTVKLKTLTPFILDQKNNTLTIQEAGKSLSESEALPTEEIFIRPSDSITIGGDIEGLPPTIPTQTNYLIISKSEVIVETRADKTKPQRKLLQADTPITGKIKEITMPQEALGMGDVKLLMLIAAALGFPNFVYAMTLGAIAGLLYVGVLRIIAIARKSNAPTLIAFGPWLSLGSIIILISEIVAK